MTPPASALAHLNALPVRRNPHSRSVTGSWSHEADSSMEGGSTNRSGSIENGR